MCKNLRSVTKWNIYNVDFGDGYGSEQGRVRPAIVVQNNVGNKYSPTTLVVPITSKTKTNLPTHFILCQTEYKFLTYEENTVLCEQVRVIDKSRIKDLIGMIKKDDIPCIEKCLKVNFDF